jgi:hypothetical protein
MAENPNPINEQNIDNAKEYLKILLDMGNVSRDITDEVKNLLKSQNDSKESYRNILNINRQINKEIFAQSDNLLKVLENQKSTKDIQKDIKKNAELIQKVGKEKYSLDQKISDLQNKYSEAVSSNNQSAIVNLKDQIIQYDLINAKLKKQQELLIENNLVNEEAKKISEEIDKKFSVKSFKFLENFTKSIPGLKAFSGSFEKAAESARGAALSGDKSILGSGLKELLGPLTKMSLVFGGIAAVLQFFIDAMFAADKRVTDIAKNLSISKDNARALYESFQQSKGILDSQLATTKNITEAFNELANISDFINISNIKQLDTQIQLTKEIGIQVEEALQLQQLFAVNNNEADKGLDIVYDQIAAFANQNKIVADGRKVISDVNRLSGLIKLNFRGNTGEIVKTVLEAKKLGLTLDQITKTQSSLLDFESSISSQIEAELLTGRQINLERARLFALNNDIAGLTEEIAKQNITAASFSRMNALQQESIAKTLGMSASELGDSLYKQELINETAGDYTKNLRENAKILRDQGKLEEANRLERQAEAVEQGIVDGKSLEQAQKSLDAQTKFNNALEHAQEIFTDLVDGGTLDSLSDVLINFAKAVDRFFGNQNLKKQALGENTTTAYNKSVLGTGLFQTTDTISKDTGLTLTEVKPLAFLGETLGDMFKYAKLKDKQGKTIESSFGSEGFEKLLEQQKLANELLKQQLNKSTDITLNGERLTSGLAKQTYALGS